ncbi:hypothetical protein [Mesorhizobium sp.]|uniref:hypothetical protein n=1 Tax=Mesorhizobium sp. TaxID=1871066 RepID=UPI000FE61AB9|nr:hypothetical protein [Mesorhizobium sp.]RWB67602.1 MAG: hypothetical protein EOQ49_25110 [Mesorhizobium sp.]
MSSLPAIVVAGQGRCGTSLMMQMLYAGGIPCVGHWPDFETGASSFGGFDPTAFAALRGKAIKLITPAELPIGQMPKHVVIWLDRDPEEQARSQLKMVATFMRSVDMSRKSIRAMAAGNRRGRLPNMAAIGANGRHPTLLLSFERLLTQPTDAAIAVDAFLHEHGYVGLNFEAMRRQIRPRSPYCYPGMMEVDLLSAPPPGRPAI